MPRRWRGPLCVEGVQTGDGRVIPVGGLEWAPLPLPLSWLRDGDQHVDLIEVAPQVGTIETIERRNDGTVWGTGLLDDEQPDGAELVRRLEAGTGALGARYGLSIDPDNWELEVVALDAGEEEGVLLASAAPRVMRLSGSGPFPTFAPITAAAGDPDPGPGGGDDGITLFTDSVDSVLFRWTRLRIRGVTACAVAAFDGAWIELDDDAAPAEEGEQVEGGAVTASNRSVTSPPSAWFTMAEPDEDSDLMVEQFDQWGNPMGVAVPLHITDDGHVFGHVAAAWNQCHTGYLDRCVSPPRSTTGYVGFHTGLVRCDDGQEFSTGALVVGCDHAPATDANGVPLDAVAARDHYANAGLGWADVRASNGRFGPWVSGALRPGLGDADLRVLRALALSGDWRPHGRGLEMVAALAVNTPGFPIAREALVASALPNPTAAAVETRVHMVDGHVTSIVAATPASSCPTCGRGEEFTAELMEGVGMAEVLRYLQRLDRRTAHLIPDAAAALRARMHGAEQGVEVVVHGNGGDPAAAARAVASRLRRNR